MTADPAFRPDPGTVTVLPQAVNCGYTRNPGGQEAVALYFETSDLGAFALLFTPEAAGKVAGELFGVASGIAEYRTAYDAEFGPGTQQ